MDYCWAKHGLPVWWKNIYSHSNNNRESPSSSDNILDISSAPGSFCSSHYPDYLCSESTTSWLLDSGASHHVIGNRLTTSRL